MKLTGLRLGHLRHPQRDRGLVPQPCWRDTTIGPHQDHSRYLRHLHIGGARQGPWRERKRYRDRDSAG